MTELKIPEVILRERQKKKLTQEQLAASLGVSPQAVSNWERGGYPDITLLPLIANFFEITVDELIGNDEVSRENDIKSFNERYWHIGQNKKACEERLTLAMEYYRKYPLNYDIIYALGDAIINNMDKINENLPLLRELHEKIISGCTNERYRKESLHRMCMVSSDKDLEQCISDSELDWGEDALKISELREERYWRNSRYDEYWSQRVKSDLLVFMHYIGRNYMMYYDSDNAALFDNPEYIAALELHKMKLLENFDESGVPQAFYGCYADACLKSAGAMIGGGKLDEGFAQLDRAFELYEKWLAIPEKSMLSFGSGIYKNAKIEKHSDSYVYDIVYADGTKVWTPYLWLFWQLKNDILCALRPENGWSWFDKVRDDPRWISAYERAKKLAE